MNKGVVLHSGSGLWLSPFRYATGAQPQTAEEWKNCWKLFTENCWIFICQFHPQKSKTNKTTPNFSSEIIEIIEISCKYPHTILNPKSTAVYTRSQKKSPLIRII